MPTLSELVQNGKTTQILDILCNSRNSDIRDSAILLSTRYTRNNKDYSRNIISRSDYNREIDKINTSLLMLIDDIDDTEVKQNTNELTPQQSNDVIESTLMAICSEYNRRNETFYNTATTILTEYQNYKHEKNINVLFDVQNRRLLSIQNKLTALQDIIANSKSNTKEMVAENIAALLVGIPSYDNLTTAYKLASALQMKDAWIEEQLLNRVEWDTPKIEIAERIENFIKEKTK